MLTGLRETLDNAEDWGVKYDRPAEDCTEPWEANTRFRPGPDMTITIKVKFPEEVTA